MEVIKKGTYGQYQYVLYKVNDKYYFQIQDPKTGKTAWGVGSTPADAARQGALKLKAELSNTSTTSNTSNTTQSTTTTSYSTPTTTTSYSTRTTQPVTGIYFGDDLERRFNYTYDDNFKKYLEERNEKLARELVTKLLEAAKQGKYMTPQEYDQLRDRLLTEILQKYGANIDWNSPGWQHTIDDIYRKAVLQLRQNGIQDWSDLYNKLQKKYGERTDLNKPNNEPVDTYQQQTQQQVVDERKKSEVEQQLQGFADKLRSMGFDGYANAVEAQLGKIKASKDLKEDVLNNYQKYIDSIQKQLEELQQNYGKEKEFIEQFLNEKFGELQAKADELSNLTDEQYQQQLDLIKKKIDNQQNIAEGLAKKGQGSYAQAYASQNKIDQDYLGQIEKAKQDYINAKRSNYNTIANLYSNWINKQQQIQGTWAKPLYDRYFYTNKDLSSGLENKYETYRGKQYGVEAGAYNAAANAMNSAQASMTQKQLLNQQLNRNKVINS